MSTYRVLLIEKDGKGWDCGNFTNTEVELFTQRRQEPIEVKTGDRIIDLLRDQKIAKLETELLKLKAEKTPITRKIKI